MARVIIVGCLAAGVIAAAASILRQGAAHPAPSAATHPLRDVIKVDARPIRAAAPRPVPSPAPAPTPSPVAAAPASGYVIRRVLDTGGPIRYGDWFWDEAGVPAGPVVITVDLKADVLSIFRGGYEIGTAAVIFGATDKETPLGVFPILQKDADHHSNIYGGAPMPYAMRLTQDGIFIHGSEVAWDAATHGCIGVPKGFAKKLFSAARIGDKVIITRGETLGDGKAIKAA